MDLLGGLFLNPQPRVRLFLVGAIFRVRLLFVPVSRSLANRRSCFMVFDVAGNSYYGIFGQVFTVEVVKHNIAVVDFKDDIIDKLYSSWTHVAMGDGNKINWPEIFQALVKDNFKGPVIYESCYIPENGDVLDGARISFAKVKEMMASVK